MTYRKKPVKIEAVKWEGDFIVNGENTAPAWVDRALEDGTLFFEGQGELYVKTLEGDMRCGVGDYLIKGVNGELYPCKTDAFEATYEDADEIDWKERVVTANDVLNDLVNSKGCGDVDFPPYAEDLIMEASALLSEIEEREGVGADYA